MPSPRRRSRIPARSGDEEDQQRGKDSDREEHAPGHVLRQPAEDDGKQRHRQRIADGVSALDRSGDAAAHAGRNHFGDQHGADRGLAAIAHALDGACDQEIPEAVGKGGGKGRDRDQEDGELQHAYPAEPVRGNSGDPAAQGGADQRAGSQNAGVRPRQAQRCDQRWCDQCVDRRVHRIERKAAEGGEEGLAFDGGQLRQPPQIHVRFPC